MSRRERHELDMDAVMDVIGVLVPYMAGITMLCLIALTVLCALEMAGITF